MAPGASGRRSPRVRNGLSGAVSDTATAAATQDGEAERGVIGESTGAARGASHGCEGLIQRKADPGGFGPNEVRTQEIAMPSNVGFIDRAARVVVGLILIAFAIPIGFPQTGWNVFGWIGVIPLVTGLVGTCPLYALLGVSTCPLKRA